MLRWVTNVKVIKGVSGVLSGPIVLCKMMLGVKRKRNGGERRRMEVEMFWNQGVSRVYKKSVEEKFRIY